MYPFRNVMIGLDLTDLDQTLMQFAKRMYHSEVTENMYFVNVLKSLEIPQAVLDEFPDIAEKALEERRTQMREVIEEQFGETVDMSRVHLVVKDGGIAKAMLSSSDEFDIDLIVMGRRQQGDNNGGLLSQRLARRAACSLLIVPEGTEPKLTKLLVPTDFSEHSTLALEEAVEIARRRPNEVEVVVQNVYNIPTGYHYSGRSKQEFAKIVRENARREYLGWVQKIDVEGINIRDVYSRDTNENPVTDIYDMAQEIQADGIIFGAKGRNATTAFFIGSLAEKMIQIDSEFPLMVVRPKGKNAGLLDILREI